MYMYTYIYIVLEHVQDVTTGVFGFLPEAGTCPRIPTATARHRCLQIVKANFGSIGTDLLPGDVVNGAKPEPKLFSAFAPYWQYSQVHLFGQ